VQDAPEGQVKAKKPRKPAGQPAGQAQQQPAAPHAAPVHVDEYRVVISHVRTKDPKVKLSLSPEQHEQFLAAIAQFLPK